MTAVDARPGPAAPGAPGASSGVSDPWNDPPTRPEPEPGDEPGGLPQAIEAEQAVLGAAMQSLDALLAAVEGGLTGAMFYRPNHELIWDAIWRLHSNGEVVDAVTVMEALRVAGELGRAGGAPYLHTLVAAPPNVGRVPNYLTGILDTWALRGLVQAGTKIVQLGRATDGGDTQTILNAAHTELGRVALPGSDKHSWSAADVMNDVIDAADVAVASPAGEGITTGLHRLDHFLDPMEAGNFVTILGWPGGGKTTLACVIARHAAVHLGVKTVYCSAEETRVEIGRRFLSATTGVDQTRMKRRTLTDNDWQRIMDGRGALDRAPLIFDDQAMLTLGYVNSLILRHRPGLLVVDQIPIMIPPDPRASREQQISQLSYGLKRMAEATGTLIVALAQLNRNNARAGATPSQHDARESAAVTQAANASLIVWDPTWGEEQHERNGEADILIAKQRSGIAGRVVSVAAQLDRCRFVTLAEDVPPPVQGHLA